MKATDKQKKLMTKLGIEFDNKVTKLEACDLIEQEFEIRAQIEDLQYHTSEFDAEDYFHHVSDMDEGNY